MKRPFLRVLLGLLIPLVLVLVACESGDSAETTSPETTEVSPETTEASPGTTEEASTTTEQPEAQVDREAVLRFGAYRALTTYDAHKAAVSPDNEILFMTYDRLVHITPGGELIPGLAESWEFGPDQSYLEMKLRDGVTFHDGATFDAEAVKANIERGKTLEDSAIAGDLSAIESVEVVDALTVRLMLGAPAGNLPAVLSDRAGAMISPDAFDTVNLDTNPVGAGMYMVEEYVPDASVTLTAFPDYWDTDAQLLGGVEVRFLLDDTARVNALRAEELDIAVQTPPSALDQLRSAEGVELVSAPGQAFHWIQTRNGRSPMDDVQVRQALYYATDRQALVDGLLFGLGRPAYQMFPEGSPAHVPELDEAYSHDPERARELLAEAGYPDGIELVMVDLAGSPLVNSTNEALQGQWAEAGIDLRIETIERARTVELFFRGDLGDMAQGDFPGRPSPEQAFLALMGPDSVLNPAPGYTSEALVAALNNALAATSEDARAQALQEAARVVSEEALVIPLYYPENAIGHSERTFGVETYTTGKMELRGVGIFAP